MWWKNFIARWGPIGFVSYLGSFIFIVFISRGRAFDGSLTGDFLLKNDMGEAVVFFPFVSSAIVAVGVVIVFQLLKFFKFKDMLR